MFVFSYLIMADWRGLRLYLVDFLLITIDDRHAKNANVGAVLADSYRCDKSLDG